MEKKGRGKRGERKREGHEKERINGKQRMTDASHPTAADGRATHKGDTLARPREATKALQKEGSLFRACAARACAR